MNIPLWVVAIKIDIVFCCDTLYNYDMNTFIALAVGGVVTILCIIVFYFLMPYLLALFLISGILGLIFLIYTMITDR